MTLTENPEWSTALFPPHLSVITTDGSHDPPPLMPDEARAVSRAVPSRQREFALGRWCARRALERFGLGNREIPVSAQRAPVWPEGIVGSITHCTGFVGAVVGSSDTYSSIGFDAERDDPLAPDLIPMICTPREAAWVRDHGTQAVDWPKVIFSAKESIHKCIWPLSGVMLDFLDVSISIDATRMEFAVEDWLGASPAGVDRSRLSGRILIRPPFVLTCAFSNPNARF